MYKITLVPIQFLIQDTDLWCWILAPNPFIAIHKNCKTTCPKVENEISNIVHVQRFLHLLKARTMMHNTFLSHSYILVFAPKSVFSITLILISITLSLVTLLGNHFSFHFIAL